MGRSKLIPVTEENSTRKDQYGNPVAMVPQQDVTCRAIVKKLLDADVDICFLQEAAPIDKMSENGHLAPYTLLHYDQPRNQFLETGQPRLFERIAVIAKPSAPRISSCDVFETQFCPTKRIYTLTSFDNGLTVGHLHNCGGGYDNRRITDDETSRFEATRELIRRGPHMILGDFNVNYLRPRFRLYNLLTEAGYNRVDFGNQPSSWYNGQEDQIFYRDVTVSNVRVISMEMKLAVFDPEAKDGEYLPPLNKDEQWTEGLSDHDAISCTVTMPSASSPT